ncbi:hypothetical protein [Streptomyces profundus]|uniref:hypothetical protein n=1 Tax=Streptomyces profundus TaxID=2867410 RepID=UPI001D16C940|nr:hypothetical protein [Streptomyces sp. MA3_2.13]UED86222.1 hypothetical protein K4G22_20170 [Streptomyces sp. MA3_2.13]
MPEHEDPTPATPGETAPAAPPKRPRRPLALLLCLLAGLLLGVGVPEGVDRARGDEADAYCWGALSLDDLVDTLSRETNDLTVAHGETPLSGYHAECRVVLGEEFKKQLTVTVGPIDDYDVDGTWAREFLHPHLLPYAGAPVGLGGQTRAWVKLAPDCRPAQGTGEARARVVSVHAQGRYLQPERDAVARAALLVTNAVLDDHGCLGSYPTDGAPLLTEEPSGSEYSGDGDEFCDTGTPSPDWLPRSTAGPTGGPFRICSGDPDDGEQRFRVLTVQDPDFEGPFRYAEEYQRHPVVGLECGDRTVWVMAQGRHLSRRDAEEIDLPALLRIYATTEAERLGCRPPA